jgi:translin
VSDLSAIEGWLRKSLDEKHLAREQALTVSRVIIRLCANAIRAIHRGERERAEGLIEEAATKHADLSAALAPHQDIYFAGYVQDAQKELAEAVCTARLIFGEPLPNPSSLSIAAAPFANGLAETVGELRRFILDQLRQNDFSRVEALLLQMDEIYSLLVTLDYPDGLTAGLRRSTDTARAILERTRGDLTVTLRQHQLEVALASVRAGIS